MSKKTPMTPAASQRVQSATTKANGGQTPKGSFASRTQATVAKKSGK